MASLIQAASTNGTLAEESGQQLVDRYVRTCSITALGPSLFFWICLSKCNHNFGMKYRWSPVVRGTYKPSCDCEVSFNTESKQMHMKPSCFWCPSFWRVASLLEDGVGQQNVACPAVRRDCWEPGLSLTEKEQIEQSSLIGGVLGENSFWLFGLFFEAPPLWFLHFCVVSIQKSLRPHFWYEPKPVATSAVGETAHGRRVPVRFSKLHQLPDSRCDKVREMQALWRQVRTLSLRILFLRHLPPREKWRKALQHGCEGRWMGEAQLKGLPPTSRFNNSKGGILPCHSEQEQWTIGVAKLFPSFPTILAFQS